MDKVRWRNGLTRTSRNPAKGTSRILALGLNNHLHWHSLGTDGLGSSSGSAGRDPGVLAERGLAACPGSRGG